MMPNSARSRALSRWGLLIVALLLGLAVIFSTLRAYLSAKSLGMTLAQGQAEIFLRAVRVRQRPDRGPPSAGVLRAVLEEHASDGLRYVGIVGPSRRMEASAGEPLSDPLVNLPSPGTLQIIGPRMRMVAPPPPHHPPPPDGMPEGDYDHPLPPSPLPHGFGFYPPPPPPPAAGDLPRVDAAMLVEFEPVLSQKLIRDAHWNLVIGLVAAVVLLAAGGVFWRLSVRADEADAALAKQQHLAALGEMSAVLAHEIRNPLAAAKGHAQLLAEQLPEGDRPRRSADRVVVAMARLEELTNNLLDFARAGEIRRQDVSPSALLSEAVESLGPESFELDVKSAPQSWSLDPLRMKQVLVNVLENALLASPEGKVAHASVALRNASLVFQVRDHGDGVPEGQEDLAFEPFHTTRVRGTGLGLAVARRIVQLHGGSIQLTNHPDGGAVVEIQLPAA